MFRYGLYTRKSRDDRKLTEKSTGEQLYECRAVAQREGLVVAWTCEESKSAKIPRVRPKYDELIDLIEAGKVDAILCWHVNRLVRNMEEGGKLVQLLIEGKIREIKTPQTTFRSGENILTVVLEAASATQFSIDLVNTVNRSFAANHRAGGWNHKALPGYRNVRDPLNMKRGLIERDGDRFELIRRGWDLMLTGTVTVAEVRDSLEEWGYLIRPTLNLPARPLGYNAVLAMFRNPFYAGFVRERGEIANARHEPMVTVEEFQRVQRIFAKRSLAVKRIHQYTYTGFMRCAYCGLQITGEVKRLRNGKDWELYHCSDPYNRCTKRGLSLRDVDKAIGELIDGAAVDIDAIELACIDIRRALLAEKTVFEARDAQILAAITEAQQRLDRLTEMWLSGLLTDRVRYQELEKKAKTERVKLELSREEGRAEAEIVLVNLANTVRYIRGCSRRFPSASPHQKRVIAQTLGSYRFFGREKRIEVEVRPALREILSFTAANSFGLEPEISGSASAKQVASLKPLVAGRSQPTRLELPGALLDALAHDILPPMPEEDEEEPPAEAA